MRLAGIGHRGDDAGVLGHAADTVDAALVVNVHMLDGWVIIQSLVIVFIVLAVLVIRFCCYSARIVNTVFTAIIKLITDQL